MRSERESHLLSTIGASLLLPGLAHLLLGERRRAVWAFGTTMLTMLLGWLILRDHLLNFAPLSAGKADNLVWTGLKMPLLFAWPEVLNVPGVVLTKLVSYDGSNTGLRLVRLSRDLGYVGTVLTATSGMLSAFWAADAAFLARRRQARTALLPAPVSPALCAALSWLVPGLGHARAGQRDKGLLLFVCVSIVFFGGLIAAEGHAVDRETHSVWWIGQSLFGGGTLLCTLFTAPLQMDHTLAHHDFGVIMCTVAGLMNLVVMVDAFTVAEKQGLVAAEVPA